MWCSTRGLANIRETTREARLRWLGHVERKTEEGLCSNENMEDGNGWRPKDRKTEPEDVIGKDMKTGESGS